MRFHTFGALAPVPELDAPPGRPALVEPEPPSNIGGWVVILIFLIAAGSAAWLKLKPAKPAGRSAATRTAVVRRASLFSRLRLSGSTVAGKSAMLLAPRMPGSRSRGTGEFQQILEKTAKPGSAVHKGDVVAQFERMYMANRLDDYAAAVAQHEANLRSLNATLEMRKKNYEQTTIRYRGERDKARLELKKAPVLSFLQAERDRISAAQYEAQLKEIVDEEKYFEISEKAAIRRSELDLRVSKMELDRARRNLDTMTVKAPMDGLLVMQTIRRGSDLNEIQAGDQLYPGQPYMQIVDLSSICVDASLNQVDVDEIRLGSPANIEFDAYPGVELPARVISIGAMARTTGWRNTFVRDVPVRLKLEKLDSRVIPNLSVSADVLLASAEDVPTVPLESIFTDPDGGKTVAFVRNPAGWEKREVELGVTTNSAAEVKSGLSAGDVVAAEWPLTEANGSDPR